MLLGALVHAGAPLGDITHAVNSLGVEPIELTARGVSRQSIAATKVDVRTTETTETRTWEDVRTLLGSADLPEPVRARALDVFARLAHAEATAHGISADQVHFHEVGALDALADVVGVCTALHALGVEDSTCSPIALGAGLTAGAHGRIPVPGPAVLELLREVGSPVYGTDVPYELCTPTGAALLAATATEWGGMPAMRIQRVGAGAGTRDLGELPNIVRVVLGEPDAAPGQGGVAARDSDGSEDAASSVETSAAMVLLETNVDDLDPRLWPAILERLLSAGAVDAWLTPILMKKGRPAHTLSALTYPADADAARDVMVTETSTLGVREWPLQRTALARANHTVDLHGCTIRVKLAYLHGRVRSAQPEYEDVACAAQTLNLPVGQVLNQARNLASSKSGTPEGTTPAADE